MTENLFYNGELKHTLEAEIDLYEHDREKYWNKALSEGDYQFWNAAYEQAEQFAEAVLQGTEALVAPSRTGQGQNPLEEELERINKFPDQYDFIAKSDMPQGEKLRRLGMLIQEIPHSPDNENSPLRLVWERLFINMARQTAGGIDEKIERTLKLYGLLLRVRPSATTQEYLARVSRCYICGFDPECMIMCRSAVEKAFESVVSYDLCEKHLGPPPWKKRGFNLDDRIWVAIEEGIIDKATAEIAGCIRLRGNDVVHKQPDLTKHVFSTVKDTITVLSNLLKSQNESDCNDQGRRPI